jgi:hypothetical protein
LWWLSGRMTRTESGVANVGDELERQRRLIKMLADVYTQQQAQLASLKLDGKQLFERALASAAEQGGLKPGELQEGINRFVSTVSGFHG